MAEEEGMLLLSLRKRTWILLGGIRESPQPQHPVTCPISLKRNTSKFHVPDAAAAERIGHREALQEPFIPSPYKQRDIKFPTFSHGQARN